MSSIIQIIDLAIPAGKESDRHMAKRSGNKTYRVIHETYRESGSGSGLGSRAKRESIDVLAAGSADRPGRFLKKHEAELNGRLERFTRENDNTRGMFHRVVLIARGKNGWRHVRDLIRTPRDMPGEDWFLGLEIVAGSPDHQQLETARQAMERNDHVDLFFVLPNDPSRYARGTVGGSLFRIKSLDTDPETGVGEEIRWLFEGSILEIPGRTPAVKGLNLSRVRGSFQPHRGGRVEFL